MAIASEAEAAEIVVVVKTALEAEEVVAIVSVETAEMIEVLIERDQKEEMVQKAEIENLTIVMTKEVALEVDQIDQKTDQTVVVALDVHQTMRLQEIRVHFQVKEDVEARNDRFVC